MGSCFSKKSTNTSPPVIVSNTPLENTKALTQVVKNKPHEESVKKEIFVIKHRKSHEVERRSEDEKSGNEGSESGKVNGKKGVGAPVRTSSCTKEEVDAILIQCGRLSRSSSTGKAGLSGSGGSDNNGGGGKRYCGSKRSFDFENEKGEEIVVDVEGDDEVGERVHRHRQRHRESRTPNASPQGRRRRTPSREREREQLQQPRSGSRERGSISGGNSNGRRVSRSPGRRSESPITSSNGVNANANTNTNAKPQKMVSVPAMAMDKNTNNGGNENIKRIQVKRNVASPRARSPAQNQQQPVTLSRSNSRKAEQSPYRRNPLTEIDNNVVVIEQKPASLIKPTQVLGNGVMKTRSSRLSRDFDINTEALTDPSPTSYAALLLEDIHNFHQKTTTTPISFTVPACVTKANSIMEAVADLNSSSSGISESCKRLEIKESEVGVNDDLMEPSFHKYVTVRRGTMREDEEESSGSNSFVASSGGGGGGGGGGSGQQHWVSSSTWEPNSADSTDRWTSSRSEEKGKEKEDFNPLGIQRNAMSETVMETKKTSVVVKKRESDYQQNGIGRGRLGTRSLH